MMISARVDFEVQPQMYYVWRKGPFLVIWVLSWQWQTTEVFFLAFAVRDQKGSLWRRDRECRKAVDWTLAVGVFFHDL